MVTIGDLSSLDSASVQHSVTVKPARQVLLSRVPTTQTATPSYFWLQTYCSLPVVASERPEDRIWTVSDKQT